MAARQEEQLLKIGNDGFRMLDAYCTRTNGRGAFAQQEPPRHNQIPGVYRAITQVAPSKAGGFAVMDCNEAAKLYGGVVIREYPKKGFFRRFFG